MCEHGLIHLLKEAETRCSDLRRASPDSSCLLFVRDLKSDKSHIYRSVCSAVKVKIVSYHISRVCMRLAKSSVSIRDNKSSYTLVSCAGETETGDHPESVCRV